MTHKEQLVKEYLQSYLKTKNEIDDILELYARLYSSATGAQIFYDRCSGAEPGDVVCNTVVELDEAKEEIINKKLEARRLKKHITEMIETFVKRERNQKIMIKTYIDGLKRAEIAEDLGCKVQDVTNGRSKGIEEIAKYINC